ncbi:MAG: hypothetical protein ACI8Q1_001346 [Parvicella sp.]
MFSSVFDAGSQTEPFKYEDNKRVSYNYDSYFAAKLNGKWGYVNWSTGDIIKEFK